MIPGGRVGIDTQGKGVRGKIETINHMQTVPGQSIFDFTPIDRLNYLLGG